MKDSKTKPLNEAQSNEIPSLTFAFLSRVPNEKRGHSLMDFRLLNETTFMSSDIPENV